MSIRRQIKGYSICRNDRQWNDKLSPNTRKCVGVCCYVKDDKLISSHELSDFDMSLIVIEISWLEIDHPRMNNISEQ